MSACPDWVIQVCIVWPVYCDQCPHARDNARLYLSPPHLRLLCPVSRACLVPGPGQQQRPAHLFVVISVTGSQLHLDKLSIRLMEKILNCTKFLQISFAFFNFSFLPFLHSIANVDQELDKTNI